MEDWFFLLSFVYGQKGTRRLWVVEEIWQLAFGSLLTLLFILFQLSFFFFLIFFIIESNQYQIFVIYVYILMAPLSLACVFDICIAYFLVKILV